jgi:hypothetical protein
MYVSASLERQNQIGRREFTIAIPISVGPGGIAAPGVLVLAGLKDQDQVRGIEQAVEISVASARQPLSLDQMVQVVHVEQSVLVEIVGQVIRIDSLTK